MKKFPLLILLLIIIFPNTSRADTRINFRLDMNGRRIDVYGLKEPFLWYGVQADIEQEWKTNKVLISGFNFGLRKEGDRYTYDGSYAVLGVFKRFGRGNWNFNPSVEVLYGFPGITFDRTWEDRQGSKLKGYTRLYLARNIDIPEIKVKNSGVLYPQVSLVIRRKLGHFNVDSVIGARLMRFGMVQSDFIHSKSEERIVPVPSFAIRTGFKF